jgi:hypothetical protein
LVCQFFIKGFDCLDLPGYIDIEKQVGPAAYGINYYNFACWENLVLNTRSKRRIYILIGVTMVTAHVGFMALPYFENMYYYGTPTPNFTKIAHDLFMKKTNPAQKKDLSPTRSKPE